MLRCKASCIFVERKLSCDGVDLDLRIVCLQDELTMDVFLVAEVPRRTYRTVKRTLRCAKTMVGPIVFRPRSNSPAFRHFNSTRLVDCMTAGPLISQCSPHHRAVAPLLNLSTAYPQCVVLPRLLAGPNHFQLGRFFATQSVVCVCVCVSVKLVGLSVGQTFDWMDCWSGGPRSQ